MTNKILTEASEVLLQENGDALLLEFLQLTIAGVDFLAQYVSGSVHIREMIQNKSGVMNMNIFVKQGQPVPLQGSEITFSDQTRRLFGGYVTRITPVELGKGNYFTYNVESSDYSFILGNKVARRAYTNMSLRDIVLDLMDTYVDSSYGFDMTNVATGPMITSIIFDHISIRKCFEKLSKSTGYIWYVDYFKNLYFTTQTIAPAPEAIKDSLSNISQVNIAYETTQVRNKVIVIGSNKGEASNAPTVQQFVSNGIDRIFALDDIPASLSYIKLNGVSQNFHVDSEQIASDYAVYSVSDIYVRLADSAVTPTLGDVIEISYYPFVAIIAERMDEDSINFFSALDGGDGVWDYTIKDQSITTKQEAAERALQELSEFADPLVKGIFTTRTSLLSPGTVFQVGQALTVNLPTYSINTDTTFLIQEINITMAETDDRIEYTYVIRFGGRLAGVQEFLESLASTAEEAIDAVDIKTIESLADSEIAEDSNLSYIKQTPPFKYSSGRKNLIFNPSFETNVTDNTVLENNLVYGDAAVTRTTSTAQSGSASAQVDISSPVDAEIWRVKLRMNDTNKITIYKDITYTISAYVKSTDSRNIQIALENVGAVSGYYSTATATNPSTWTRISLTFVATADDLMSLNILCNNGLTGSVYIDAGLVEVSGSLANYFDGSVADTSTIDRSWEGAAHNSVSQEITFTSAATRARWNLSEWS